MTTYYYGMQIPEPGEIWHFKIGSDEWVCDVEWVDLGYANGPEVHGAWVKMHKKEPILCNSDFGGFVFDPRVPGSGIWTRLSGNLFCAECEKLSAPNYDYLCHDCRNSLARDVAAT